MRSLRTQLAYAAAGVTVALALLALLNPALAARVLGLGVVEPRGLSEIRATYGAMFLVIGGVMLWAIPMRPSGAPWLRFAGILWIAMAVGRALSTIIDADALSLFNVLAIVVQAGIGAAAVVGSFQTPVAVPAGVEVEDDAPNPLRAYRG